MSERFVEWPREIGFTSRHVAMSDGTRLRVVRGGDPSKPKVLFLHGAPQMAFEWRRILPRIAERAHVLAPDLRGFGASDLASTGDYAMPRLVRDVKEVLDDAGGGPAIVVAHDWGGVIAWRFVEEHRSSVKHLVATNAPLLELYARDLLHLRQLVRSWYVLTFQVPYLDRLVERAGAEPLVWMMKKSSRGVFSDDDLEVYRASMRRPGRASAIIAYYRSAFPSSRAGMRATFRPIRIEVPTTLLWGTWDRAIDRAHAERIRGAVSSIEVRYLDGVSHWVPEERPDAVIDAIEAVL
jgi:pimeloyl-ACP methyl ester carboxylesterase